MSKESKAKKKVEITEDQIVISKKEYVQLLKDSLQLSLLESGGVDNWEWYSESLRNEQAGGGPTFWDQCDELDEKYFGKESEDE